jgi:hypothetical protein
VPVVTFLPTFRELSAVRQRAPNPTAERALTWSVPGKRKSRDFLWFIRRRKVELVDRMYR